MTTGLIRAEESVRGASVSEVQPRCLGRGDEGRMSGGQSTWPGAHALPTRALIHFSTVRPTANPHRRSHTGAVPEFGVAGGHDKSD